MGAYAGLSGETPILALDVWEHAYYLDTKNDRKSFLTSFIKKLANWEHAGALFSGAGQTLDAAA